MKMYNLALLLLLFFCCCNKSSNIPATKPVAFTFSTTYDSVLTTYANKSVVFSFSVDVLTGSMSGDITYTITGLPTGVTISPGSIAVSGQLGGLFNLSVGNVATGTYKLDFVSSNTVAGTVHHTLKLIVVALPDYSALLAGTYPHSHNYCQPQDTLYSFSSVVSTVTGTPYTVKIGNMWIFDTSLNVTASLSTIVTIPFQTIGTYSIWGSGTYTHDNTPYDSLYLLTINDTTVHGTDTSVGLVHIQH